MGSPSYSYNYNVLLLFQHPLLLLHSWTYRCIRYVLHPSKPNCNRKHSLYTFEWNSNNIFSLLPLSVIFFIFTFATRTRSFVAQASHFNASLPLCFRLRLSGNYLMQYILHISSKSSAQAATHACVSNGSLHCLPIHWCVYHFDYLFWFHFFCNTCMPYIFPTRIVTHLYNIYWTWERRVCWCKLLTLSASSFAITFVFAVVLHDIKLISTFPGVLFVDAELPLFGAHHPQTVHGMRTSPIKWRVTPKLLHFQRYSVS